MNEPAAKLCASLVWHRAPDTYVLPPNEVHVWRASLHQSPSSFARLLEALSAQECARAERYHFEPDRRRSIIGHGLARLLLAHCLGVSAQDLRFNQNAFGKPELPRGAVPHLHFNISHSGEWILIALSLGRELGIDVEHERKDMATAEIAARFFSPLECSTLAALPTLKRCEAFFSCWTRKEAYLKARGDGLSLPLDQFDVAFAPGQEPRLISTRHDPAEAHRWKLMALHAGPGYAAALAVEGGDWKLKCWDWASSQAVLAPPTPSSCARPA
jgi:4'-phosphopantetheinyl transferase